jgi:FkbM family methyltransferase
MRVYKRAIGALSRRLGRPELLAAVDATARSAQRDELAIAAVLAAALPGEGTYVDVGTNRGQVLSHALRVAPAGRHLAFEPVPALVAEVRAAFPQVECRQLALGASRGRVQFCHFTRLDGWSGLRRNPSISDEQGRPEYFDVDVSTLDEEIGSLRPKVVKIDVEGAELAVLEGARSLLAGARPLVIFEHVPETAAVYGHAPEAPWDLLAQAGYRVFSITGEGPFTRGRFAAATGTVNWLAAPDD